MINNAHFLLPIAFSAVACDVALDADMKKSVAQQCCALLQGKKFSIINLLYEKNLILVLQRKEICISGVC
ncbi:MAG: hypothetical protein OQK24_09630 [Magnetovibrio sp.]|nr:hypothetical protein [Magnetovibrio sp.]